MPNTSAPPHDRDAAPPAPGLERPTDGPRLVEKTWFALTVIALFGVVYVLVERLLLRGFPFSGDEYSVVVQAELFARGLLRSHAPENADLLRVDHVVMDEWVRSKYPPGTPALLALGVRMGLPWLVTPLEGVVTLGLVWQAARRLFGAREAMTTLLLLGAAPLFIFNAASYFSHTTSLMWLAGAFLAATTWTFDKRDRWLLLVGLCLGADLTTRPADAVLFGASFLALRSWRLLPAVALGVAPFALLLGGYQLAQFGGVLRDGYTAYEPTFRALYGEQVTVHPIALQHLLSGEQHWHHLDVLRALAVDWTVWGTVLLALFGARAVAKGDRARPMCDVSVAAIVIALVALMPMIASPDDGARPRYLSPLLIALCVLAAPGWPLAKEALARLAGTKVTRAIAIIAVFFGPVQTAAVYIGRMPDVWAREGLYDAVESAGIKDGIVVVRAKYPSRYARNGAFFDRPVLYLSAPPSMGLDAVALRYPNRAIYEAKEGWPWTVEAWHAGGR